MRQIIVIFGASGDLTKRKLIPALYMLDKDGDRGADYRILGVGRSVYDGDSYRAYIEGELTKYVKNHELDDSKVKRFIGKIDYLSMDPSDINEYHKLRERLDSLSINGSADSYLYYFSTPPKLYKVIPSFLASAGLAKEEPGGGYRRVIVEKPFGYDLESATSISREICRYFNENQIYRIDHFLGKETVQNIMALRFANGIFEPIWNRNYIERIEITAVENLGIEKRGGYYEETGALRDMVQNHLIQLVALCAAEPPVSFTEKEFRDEIVKVYRSIKPFSKEDIEKSVVRGQYTSSERNGEYIKGYREEAGVDPSSHTETFVAMKLEIANWRWKGVPFYIRTGKHMPTKVTEIVIHFRKTPHYLFNNLPEQPVSNQLIIRIQPNEGVLLKFALKQPGRGFEIKPVSMDFTYDSLGGLPTEDAYMRLIEDCMSGDPTLFTRSDAVEQSWKIFDPVIKYWNENKTPLYGYPAGTWGPLESDLLMEGGATWTNPCKNLTNTDIYCEL